MFLGHFGVALGAKRVAPKTSLGTLFLAAQFADLLWAALLLAGAEKVRIDPGITRVTPVDFISYPYSHSLVAQLIWGTAIGLAYWGFRRSTSGAIVLALCVPSHWLLDYISHRPDMPIVPGGARYGLGLWNSVPATLAVELGLFVVGSALYLSGTRAKHRIAQYSLWSLLVLLVTIYIGSVFGPPPPNAKVLAITTSAIWLTIPWATWADRHCSILRDPAGE